MFEAKCPSCSATYQVDERRVPSTGLKMRCPKCGESFQVSAPGSSTPPVLGAALGLSSDATKTAPPPKHKATMLGVPQQAADVSEPPRPAAPRPGGPPRPEKKNTMLGVAPAGVGLELASLEDDVAEEIDLEGDDEFDLSAGGASDLPAPSSRDKAAAQIDLPSIGPDEDDAPELPSPAGELPELPSLDEEDLSDELDLPTIGGAALPARPDSAGLPAPVGEVGLPAAAEADLPDLGADLPDLGADLPDLGADLPDLDAGLPTVGSGNLPQPAGQLPSLSAGLPEQSAGNLPENMGDDFGEVDPFESGGGAPDSLDFDEIQPGSAGDEMDLSGNAAGSDLSSADDIFGQGPKTTPESVAPGAPSDGSAFGEVDLGGGGSAGVEEEDEFDAFPTEDAGSTDMAGGGDGYGDVSLEGGGGDFDLGADVEHQPSPDGGGLPPGPTAAASAAVEVPAHVDKFSKKDKKGKKKKKERTKTTGLSKGTRVGLAAVLALAVGGGALALVPDVGPYGAFYALDMLNADENKAHLRKDVGLAEERLFKDTSEEITLAFTEVDRGRQRAPRFKERAAYAAFLGHLHQLRFRASSSVSAQAQVLLNGLADSSPADVEYLALARVTAKAAGGSANEAVADASRLIGLGGSHALVAGEAALLAGNPEVAMKAWIALNKGESSPRASFGLARAFKLSGKEKEARAHIDATLKVNPQHAGARLLLAEIQLRSRELDEAIVKSLTPLSAGKDGASQGEQVHALVLLGRLHLERSRIKKAETSFTAALKIDSGSGLAQRGLAQAMFESGRFSEALARFEAAVQANAGDLVANLGLVQCKLELEQLEDAVKLLDSLLKKHPKSSAVAYWVGRGKERIGKKELAEKAYEQAIELEDGSPEVVRAYIALTRLLGQRGSLKEAQEVISLAEKKFPSDPAVYEALGELSANRGSFEDAVADYDKALELDPNNIGLRFSRGVALRQARRFEEAMAEFDRVESESPEYPGLALERGNLYEASGKSEEALKAYEAALAAAPDDNDLKLRVACGKASAGQSKSPLKLLKPLLELRPNSAEVNFCYGLALLNAEGDLGTARMHIQRAVNRDPTRAKHHLYMGWVALDMGELPLAGSSFDKAIGLDQTLADAYWKRGELRVKQRAVRDALVDLDKALELSPSRLEAYAQKAMAFLELGKEQDAMLAYEKAVSKEPVAASWHYKYGDLLLANRRPQEARTQLAAAIEKAKAKEVPSVWLATAHRLMASAIGRHSDAIPHWQAFLKAKQGTQDPYIKEALKELNAILSAQGH